MSIATLILGASGSGKSFALRNLVPDDTLLIQVVKKPLPFRATGWSKLTAEGGNIIHCDDWSGIIKFCGKTRRKVIVIDDFQYLLANEFMRRSDERGYDKFTDIGKHAWEVMMGVNNLADDVRVYILAHTEETDAGRTKMKTIGKMLDEKITPEGLFTIVLRAGLDDGKHYLSTRNTGADTVKSPAELFDDDRIPNDLAVVDSAICEYYGLTQPKAD